MREIHRDALIFDRVSWLTWTKNKTLCKTRNVLLSFSYFKDERRKFFFAFDEENTKNFHCFLSPSWSLTVVDPITFHSSHEFSQRFPVFFIFQCRREIWESVVVSRWNKLQVWSRKSRKTFLLSSTLLFRVCVFHFILWSNLCEIQFRRDIVAVKTVKESDISFHALLLFRGEWNYLHKMCECEMKKDEKKFSNIYSTSSFVLAIGENIEKFT